MHAGAPSAPLYKPQLCPQWGGQGRQADWAATAAAAAHIVGAADSSRRCAAIKTGPWGGGSGVVCSRVPRPGVSASACSRGRNAITPGCHAASEARGTSVRQVRGPVLQVFSEFTNGAHVVACGTTLPLASAPAARPGANRYPIYNSLNLMWQPIA